MRKLKPNVRHLAEVSEESDRTWVVSYRWLTVIVTNPLSLTVSEM